MDKNAMMAAVLSAILLTSALALAPQYVSADSEHKEKENGREKPAVLNFVKDPQKQGDNNADKASALMAQNVTIKAKGFAVEKGSGGYKVSDATLSLSGNVQRLEGNHARTVLAGTLDVGSQHYQIQAEGKMSIDGKFGTIQIGGKAGNARLQMHGIIILAQNDGKTWKFFADPAAKLGGHTRIYGIAGEAQLAGTISPPHNTAVKLTVKGADTSGNPLSGLYVNLAKGNATVATGYTPFAFSVESGTTYTVAVSDYQGKVFDHWDNGSANRTRTVTLSADTTLTAYYKTSVPSSTLTVNAVGPDGSAQHMWTVIQSGDSIVQSGYTPLNYQGNSGATYAVSVSDYQDLVFDHWENGSTDRTRTVTLSSATTVTAYFKSSLQSSGLDHFVISRIGNQEAGSDFTFAVTAIDGLGRIKTAYTGTIAINTNNVASPAGQANILPASYTFTSADAGQHLFTARMYSAKIDATITVAGDGKSTTSNAFSVSPASVASVAISPSSATVASGGSASFGAQAHDAYGNQITDATFVWTLGVSSLGSLAVSSGTASVTFTGASVVAASTSSLNVSVTSGGATATNSATVNVNPA